jgi:hypothetical protein
MLSFRGESVAVDVSETSARDDQLRSVLDRHLLQ